MLVAFEDDSHIEWFEGNYQDYEAGRRRLGDAADRPQRLQYPPDRRLVCANWAGMDLRGSYQFRRVDLSKWWRQRESNPRPNSATHWNRRRCSSRGCGAHVAPKS